MVMTEERLLTVRDVAERLAVHENTILNWLRRGQLRGYRVGGTKAGWRVKETDLVRFMERRANMPQEPEPR